MRAVSVVLGWRSSGDDGEGGDLWLLSRNDCGMSEQKTRQSRHGSNNKYNQKYSPVESSLIDPIEALRTRLCDLEPRLSNAPFIERVRLALLEGLCPRVSGSCIVRKLGISAVPGGTVPANPVPLASLSSTTPCQYTSWVSTACSCSGAV